MKGYIGVDIGGTTTKIGFFDEKQLLKKIEIQTRTADGGKYILEDVAVVIQKTIFQQNDLEIEWSSVGVGLPGPVNADGYMKGCVNLNWKDCYPAKELERLISLPVIVGNDANVAALGEQWKGAGQGYDNLILVTLGTGVGSGIILNGVIVNGRSGLAGEIGHISVNPDEKEMCNCGNRGCLDQVASATGIVRYTQKFLKQYTEGSCLRKEKQLTAEIICNAARKGDVISVQSIHYCMRFLAKALAAVSHVIEPDVCVIGGGVSKMGESLSKIIYEELRDFFYLNKEYPEVKIAQLGNDAGIYGAAKMAQLYKE